LCLCLLLVAAPVASGRTYDPRALFAPHHDPKD
jgi:hypothetical protein